MHIIEEIFIMVYDCLSYRYNEFEICGEWTSLLGQTGIFFINVGVDRRHQPSFLVWEAEHQHTATAGLSWLSLRVKL